MIMRPGFSLDRELQRLVSDAEMDDLLNDAVATINSRNGIA
jgi:hypothetical protein